MPLVSREFGSSNHLEESDLSKELRVIEEL